jgi:hypothetical protein
LSEPLNDNALPSLPLTHVGELGDVVPVLPLPEKLVAIVPVPSLKLQ